MHRVCNICLCCLLASPVQHQNGSSMRKYLSIASRLYSLLNEEKPFISLPRKKIYGIPADALVKSPRCLPFSLSICEIQLSALISSESILFVYGLLRMAGCNRNAFEMKVKGMAPQHQDNQCSWKVQQLRHSIV